MNVIGHEHIRVHRTLGPVAAFQQKLSIELPIAIIHEDGSPVVAALHMVNGNTRKKNARHARHTD